MNTPIVADVVEQSRKPVTTRRTCNIYRDVFGAWRWEFRDAHGDMCDSLDSFDTYEACVAAAQRVGLWPWT